MKGSGILKAESAEGCWRPVTAVRGEEQQRGLAECADGEDVRELSQGMFNSEAGGFEPERRLPPGGAVTIWQRVGDEPVLLSGDE